MCFNLLDYIEQIEKDSTNLTPAHRLIVALKPQLIVAWDKFKRDPLYMTRNILKKTGKN